MTTDVFRASVQYGDFKGTASADRADQNDASSWLSAKGLKHEHEFLVGITLSVTEVQGQHQDQTHVNFLLAERGDHDTVKAAIDAATEAFVVRSVQVNMSITEFLALFKRFSIYVSNHGMLDGKEYRYPD